jgi:hypothetical protein
VASGGAFRTRFAVGGLAVAFLLATGPAESQFMSGTYPVIIVPPPAQNMVMPKPAKPKQTTPQPPPPSDASETPQANCHYQGQTRICN